ncbi:MAG: MFS transporter [Anaerolineales bacterium]
MEDERPITHRPTPPRRGLLARLLRLDVPVPERTPGERAVEVRRNYSWNFGVNLLDGVAFWLGISLASSSTILPLFISKLTESPLPVGLLAIVAQGGWFFPQLFTANAVEQLPRRKPVVINLGLFLERLPWWLLILAPLLALDTPAMAVVIVLVAYSWHTLGAGLVATAWQDLIARIIPVERRGLFMGLTSALGTGAGALGALLSAYVIEAYAFPRNFFYLFIGSASFITLSWFFLSLTREPVVPITGTRRSSGEFWSRLPAILRSDRNFRRYLVARSLMALGAMGAGFVTLSAVRRWQVPDGMVGQYTLALLAGQASGNLLLGLAADRFGHKRNMVIGTAAGTLAFIIAWLAPAPTWYYAVFVLQGVAGASIFVSGIVLVMEFCPPEEIPTYTGLGNTLAGAAGLVAPLIGTALASANYRLLFGASAVVNLLSCVLMNWWVREPRWTEGRERETGAR